MTFDTYAKNNKFGLFLSGEADFSNIEFRKNPRNYTTDELDLVRTIFEVKLPFCLHGIHGNWRLNDSSGLRIFTETVPREVAQYTTSFDEISSSGLYLYPDNWGKVNFSLLLIVFYKFIPLSLDQTSDSDLRFETQIYLDEYNLDMVCQHINPVIDKYCLVTKNNSIRRVAPNDFLSFTTWQDFKGENYKYIFGVRVKTLPLPSSSL